MAWTQSDLDNLDAAIASGVRMVTIGGQTTTYQTTESLKEARRLVAESLAGAAAVADPAVRPRATRARMYYGGRGFG